MSDKDCMPIMPAEYDALAKDAARYRWLRANWDAVTGLTWRDPSGMLDGFVDDQMAREPRR